MLQEAIFILAVLKWELEFDGLNIHWSYRELQICLVLLSCSSAGRGRDCFTHVGVLFWILASRLLCRSVREPFCTGIAGVITAARAAAVGCRFALHRQKNANRKSLQSLLLWLCHWPEMWGWWSKDWQIWLGGAGTRFFTQGCNLSAHFAQEQPRTCSYFRPSLGQLF